MRSIYTPFKPSTDGRASEINLRDIYWGVGSKAIAYLYLDNNRPIYSGSWHNNRRLRMAFPSLDVGVRVPGQKMQLCARAVELGLLRIANISVCGSMFGWVWEQPSLTNGVVVGRALGLNDWMTKRFCAHINYQTRDCARGLVECALAGEMLICTLEPLRLPPYVLLEIALLLLDPTLEKDGPKSWSSQFISNVMRVYSKARLIRDGHDARRVSIKQ